MKKVLIWVLFLLFGTIQMAAADDVSLTQTYFNHWAKENGVVGAALSVNNKIYLYGDSDEDLALPITEKTPFGIGSITKTFVSVTLLKLEAEGKVNINDPITNYLPQYSTLKNITIKSLMQMTAGFNDVADDSVPPLQQVDRAYKQYDPALAGRWLYSNVSYQLLGILIEKITQQSLSEVLSKYITSPLHLSSVYFPDETQALPLKEYQNGKVKLSNFKNKYYAAGGLVSNIRDLNAFIYHLLIIKDLLPEKQYKEMMTFVKTPKKYYAFTGEKEMPKFGLGIFQWNIPPFGNVLTYPGVLGEGFTSAYTVIDNTVIISQSNTYNNNDFTILWPCRAFTKGLLKFSHFPTAAP